MHIKRRPPITGGGPKWPALLVAVLTVALTGVLAPGAARAVRGPEAGALSISDSRPAPDETSSTTVAEPTTTASTVAPVSIDPPPTEAPTTTSAPAPATTAPAPKAKKTSAPPAAEPASSGLPSWLAGVPYASQIDWVLKPGTNACAGSAGAAWWPNGDTISWKGGQLTAEHASNQVCVSLDSPHPHDVALHEAAHWWQAHVIGVPRIHADYGDGYPINGQADYVRFSSAILERMADCAAQSWGATWVHYGCPASLAHAYGL
jgi:hypothetical protein